MLNTTVLSFDFKLNFEIMDFFPKFNCIHFTKCADPNSRILNYFSFLLAPISKKFLFQLLNDIVIWFVALFGVVCPMKIAICESSHHCEEKIE